jgi:hypothetical protein
VSNLSFVGFGFHFSNKTLAHLAPTVNAQRLTA